MKAVAFDLFGGPKVLYVCDLPDPQPGPGEIRIKIKAAGVNPVDAKIRRGLLQQRIPHELPVISGWDVAGVVESRGEGCHQFERGDEVYSYARKPWVKWGCYAEYIVLPETQVALKPRRANFAEAASIPLAALTAWQSLFDVAGLREGHAVLIHAGAGGVGGFAIQLAKLAGAQVIATGSQKNHDYMRQLGADVVVDYTVGDFREAVRRWRPEGVNIAFDTVGGEVQVWSADVVKKGGVLISILAYQDEDALKRKGIQTKYHFVAPHAGQLAELARRFDDGGLTTRLADVFSLEQAAEAHRRIETGHTAGKLVLAI